MAGPKVRLDLEMKVEDMNKEDPKCIQVLRFDQNVVISMYPPGIGADVCRALNDGVVEMMGKSKYRARFIPVAADLFPVGSRSGERDPTNT